MTLNQKRLLIAILSIVFIVSLIFVQWMEVIRRAEEAGVSTARVSVPASSQKCVECHTQTTPRAISIAPKRRKFFRITQNLMRSKKLARFRSWPARIVGG